MGDGTKCFSAHFCGDKEFNENQCFLDIIEYLAILKLTSSSVRPLNTNPTKFFAIVQVVSL